MHSSRDTTFVFRPSPIFFAVLGLTVFSGYLCTTSWAKPELAVFMFATSGWILSLIFHEFAHAYVAFWGGDASVVSKGYLDLDPRRYSDPVFSLVLPMIFLLMGGVALPGGAVWINRGAIRSRNIESMMSLAGPASNLAFGVILVVFLKLSGLQSSQAVLASAISLLAHLQILAFVLNMLPVPGLDGYGAIEPHLSHDFRSKIYPYRQYGFWILLAALFFVPPVSRAFFSAVDTIGSLIGVEEILVDIGWSLFFFWR